MKIYLKALLFALIAIPIYTFGMEGERKKGESEASPQSKSMVIDRELNILKTMKDNPEAPHEPSILDYLFGKNKCRFIWALMSNSKFRNPDAYPLMQKLGAMGKKEAEEMLKKLFDAIDKTPPLPLLNKEGRVEVLEFLKLFSGKNCEDLKILKIKKLINQGVDLEQLYGVRYPLSASSDYVTSLHLATYYLNIPAMQLILDQGVSPNIKDDNHRTPLWNAIDMCEIDRRAAELLLKHGADINAQDRWGNTILHCCSAASKVEFLINQNADVTIKDLEGNTPLHTAACLVDFLDEDWSIIACLIKAGADIFAKNNYGKTPLDLAKERRNSTSIITYLEQEESRAREKLLMLKN